MQVIDPSLVAALFHLLSSLVGGLVLLASCALGKPGARPSLFDGSFILLLIILFVACLRHFMTHR